MKRILRLGLLTALLPLLSSCCVADWWHDWYYGDRPLPQSPIAPIAKPMPDKYTAADAVALMTDSLIFALSGVSGNGLPVVHYVITQKPQPLAEKVYRSLLQSRIIRPGGQNEQRPDDFLLFSGSDSSGNWYMVLERADRSRTLFNQTLKLKEQVRQ